MPDAEMHAVTDPRPRWRRWVSWQLNRYRTRAFSWHGWLWYHIHRLVLDVLQGDRIPPRIMDIPQPFHRWLCARWVPEWDAHLARMRAAWADHQEGETA